MTDHDDIGNISNDVNEQLDRDPTDATFEGRAFPSETEWLELQLSHDEEAELLTDDFVERTLLALRDPTPEVLGAFAPPPVSNDFIARTVNVLQAARRERWRELLARYVAPEPSPEFVARTLRALSDSSVTATVAGTSETKDPRPQPLRRRSPLRTWALPLLAAAAALAVALWLPDHRSPPVELVATESIPTAFGPAHAASPLPALLATLDHNADPYALADRGADGLWLLLQRNR